MSMMKFKKLFGIAVLVLLCLFAACAKSDAHVHTLIWVEPREGTCVQNGTIGHWICETCGKYFSDEACTSTISAESVTLPKGDHGLTHQPMVGASIYKNGMREHWRCIHCEKLFLDAEGRTPAKASELVLKASLEIDFLVEVEEGRDPVILQLTDPQIIDGSQARSADRLSASGQEHYAKGKVNALCYQYIKETVQTTKPDLILVTGDLVYGEFDDNGSAFLGFISLMESLGVPWAPVFGNHEGESAKGIDWQCDQLEAAEHCLFKQRTLTGNGNYTVGIEQGGKLKRVFFMMDSNGCGFPSEKTLENKHFKATEGFGADQIIWYTSLATKIGRLSADTKISFAFHIQLHVFADAFAKYGFDNKFTDRIPVYIDRLKIREEGDFGYLCANLKTPWDESKTVWEGLKSLGVDSIFVGHEHCNSASVVYEGVRLQFGQKSSTYDRFNYIATHGKISREYYAGCIPLIGGTVMTLSEADGSIVAPYIFYCKDAGGSVNWSKWENTK